MAERFRREPYRTRIMRKMKINGWRAVAAIFGAIAFAGCGPWPLQVNVPPSIRQQKHLEPATEWDSAVNQMVPDVHFDAGESVLHAEDRAALRNTVPTLNAFIRQDPDVIFVIEGHSDDVGSSKFNRELGTRRAEAVRELLAGEGVPASHLRIASLGNSEPLCSIREDACRDKNRRVHLRAARFIGKQG